MSAATWYAVKSIDPDDKHLPEHFEIRHDLEDGGVRCVARVYPNFRSSDSDEYRMAAESVTTVLVAVNERDALRSRCARLEEALQLTSEQWHYAHPVDGRGRAAYLDCQHPDCKQARAALEAK